MSMIHTVLVANRGEIACRVLRTVRAMGLRGVAVYSDADADAPHVRMADEAVRIGPAPAAESYLRIDAILDAARTTGADAIHPGYGFLSENAAFATACDAAGIRFIGPDAHAIEVMGNKAESKRRMIEAGVPCIPGYEGTDQHDETMISAAERIGFPLMVKAAAGGGGRGMRLVHDPAELLGALQRARSEALNAFGSDELILERAVLQPRHVEIQVFADTHGHAVHLGERDCSVQRRHQKVLEESPCPVMTPELRSAMGAAAVKVAQAINYRGAGTVEFLLDAEKNFYFLEMNTRLQVEHPVTELVTGQDLVEWQIRVAQGEALPCEQEAISLAGHAIEARLYCEDPAEDFLPATGHVDGWRPAQGEGIRIDAGIASGSDVSPFYDPMVAKVIAYGPSRDMARRRLIKALKDTALFGPRTNKSFLIRALEHPVFAAGEATTAFIGENFDCDLSPPQDGRLPAIAAVLLLQLQASEHLQASLSNNVDLLNWSSGFAPTHSARFGADADAPTLRIQARGTQYQVSSSDTTWAIAALTAVTADSDRAEYRVDGDKVVLQFQRMGYADVWISLDGLEHRFVDVLNTPQSAAAAVGSGDVAAPMHGVVLEVHVAEGDTVTKGQPLAVLEAMKMQHELLSAVAGTVVEVRVAVGQQVAGNDILIRLDSASEDAATETEELPA